MRYLYCLLFFFAFASPALAQYPGKVLIADKYGTKRIKMAEGDEIRFRLKGEELPHTDYIAQIKDSTIVLGELDFEIPISHIEQLYFRRKWIAALGPKLNYMGLGFLASALMYRAGYFYSPKESVIIGGSFIGVAQLSKAFRVKRFKIGENSRLRIIDLSMQNMGAKE